MMKLKLLLSTATIASTGAFTIQTKSYCSTTEMNNYSTVKWSPRQSGGSSTTFDPSIHVSSPTPSSPKKSYAKSNASWKDSPPKTSSTGGYLDIVSMSAAFNDGPVTSAPDLVTTSASTPVGSGGPMKKSYAKNNASWKTSPPKTSGTGGYLDIVAMGPAFENGPVTSPSSPVGSGGPMKKNYAKTNASWKTATSTGSAMKGYLDIVAMGSAFEDGPVTSPPPVVMNNSASPPVPTAGSGGPMKKNYAKNTASWKTSGSASGGTGGGYIDNVQSAPSGQKKSYGLGSWKK